MDNEQKNQQVVYALEDNPGLLPTVVLGLQHVLAMFVGIITPPLIIAGHLQFDAAETTYLLSMALIVSGLTTMLQIKRRGPLGSGLLGVQGTSFTFIPAAKLSGSMAHIIGMTIITAAIELFLSRFIKAAKKIFPPVVMGTVVTLIGLELIRVGITDLAGGFGARING